MATKVATKKTSTKTVAPKKAIVKVAKKPVETPVSAPVSNIKLVKYSHPNLKVSPRKLRLLANSLKSMAPSEVVAKLKFVNTNAARHFLEVVKNAIATAKNNYNLNPEALKFQSVEVGEGLKVKRMDKSHGSRFARGVRVKRHSRLNIVLSGTIQS